MAALKVVFKGPYDKKMNQKFFRYYMLRNSFFMYLLSAGGLYCLFALLTGAVNAEEGSFEYVLAWSITFLGIFFVPAYTFFNIKAQSKRDYNRRKDLIEAYEITKEKIQRTIVGNGSKVALNWLNIKKIVEVDDAFYFFTVNEETFTIGKNTLIEGTIDGLRQLINAYLKKSKKGKIPYVIKDKEYKKVLKEKKKLSKGIKK